MRRGAARFNAAPPMRATLGFVLALALAVPALAGIAVLRDECANATWRGDTLTWRCALDDNDDCDSLQCGIVALESCSNAVPRCTELTCHWSPARACIGTCQLGHGCAPLRPGNGSSLACTCVPRDSIVPVPLLHGFPFIWAILEPAIVLLGLTLCACAGPLLAVGTRRRSRRKVGAEAAATLAPRGALRLRAPHSLGA